MSARPQTSTKFLQHAFPEGPWKLSAATPDAGTGSLPTHTFAPGSESAMERWISEKNGGGANLYFELQLSDPKKARKKSRKADIVAARVLALDLDCGADRVDEVFARIARGDMPSGIPRPSVAITSGNGIWPLWPLSETTDDLETVEAILQGLRPAFSWAGVNNSCWNLDRIARLPGTVDYPDKKKRDRGAVETVAGWAPL